MSIGCVSTPHLMKKTPISLGQVPSHSQRVFLIDVLTICILCDVTKVMITANTWIRWTENRHYCQTQIQAQSATYRHTDKTVTQQQTQTQTHNTYLENNQLKYMCCWDTRGKSNTSLYTMLTVTPHNHITKWVIVAITTQYAELAGLLHLMDSRDSGSNSW